MQLEERKQAAKKTPRRTKKGKHAVPKGFINETIRGTRKTLTVYVFDASVAMRAWETS
jgi:hypothetical protein